MQNDAALQQLHGVRAGVGQETRPGMDLALLNGG